ncbi:MAG: hypothetical protein ACRD2L_00260 [Terriglobia bacterium]
MEQAGTYVESYTKIHNYDLTTEEIQTIAGGVLEVEVLEKTRRLVGDGLRFSIKIKAAVTTDKMEELAQRIKGRGRNVAGEYKKLQDDYGRLSKELESWKQLLRKAPPGPQREAALDEIRESEKAFAALQKSEAAFFKRVVSGQELFAEAKRQLAEHLARKLEAEAKLASLAPQVWEHGHTITIGEPRIRADFSDPENAELTVPVTVEGNEAVRLAVEEAENFFLSRGSEGRDSKVEFRKNVARLLEDLEFVLDVALENGDSYRYRCPSASVFVKIELTDYFFTISEGKSRFLATLMMPLDKVRQINALQGKFLDTPKGKFLDAPTGERCWISGGGSDELAPIP